ncbi:MAG TPA: hypothetical protein VIZ17_07970 [Acetobacteraceae bacterium]
MSVLVDHEINALLKQAPPLATNVSVDDFIGPKSPVQAASLDLTIGDIFLPGVGKDELGDITSPRTSYMLLEGQTAVVRTKEVLHMPHDLIAIGFPPASLSVRGLLMTSPGQVDPGYNGPLHLTVINMSKDPFRLPQGERIMRLIFMKLNAKPQATYDVRHRGPYVSLITRELMAGLSPDFLGVERRASQISDAAVTKAQLWSAGIAALLAAVITVGVPALTSDSFTPLKDEIAQLKAHLTVLDGRLGEEALKERLQRIEDSLKPPIPQPSTSTR